MQSAARCWRAALQHSASRTACLARSRPMHNAPRWFRSMPKVEQGSVGNRCRWFGDLASSDPPNDDAVLPPGVESPGDKLVMVYTCSVCETRAAKTISKHAYHNGVVLVRCPGCENLHLIADRLGWFEDEATDVESLLRAKGESVRLVTNEDVLELTDIEVIKRSMDREE